MPDFTVDIDGLVALGKNLNRTADNLDEASKRLDDLGPDSIGPDDLDEATEDFRSDWEEGLDKLRDATESLKGGVDGACQRYAAIEQALTNAFKQMEADVRDNMSGGH